MIENKIAADARIEHTAATPAIHVDKYMKQFAGFPSEARPFFAPKGRETICRRHHRCTSCIRSSQPYPGPPGKRHSNIRRMGKGQARQPIQTVLHS